MINKIITGGERNDLEELLNIKYTDLINEYLKSKEFQEFIESMKKKDIFEADKFKFFAENFINNIKFFSFFFLRQNQSLLVFNFLLFYTLFPNLIYMQVQLLHSYCIVT